MVKKTFSTQINLRLKEERLKRNWTQSYLAERIGSSDLNISRWERGISTPTIHFRRQLCDLFNLSPHELGLLALSEDAAQSPDQVENNNSALPLHLHKNHKSLGGGEIEKLIDDLLRDETVLCQNCNRKLAQLLLLHLSVRQEHY